MKKKLLILVPWLVGHGQERMAVLSAELLKEKYDVEIVVFDDTRREYETSVNVISLCAQSKSSVVGKTIQVFRRAVKMIRYRNRCNAYAVVSFGTSANITNALSGIASGKTIISFRGYETVKKDLANTISCLLADTAFCVSKQMCTDFGEIYPRFMSKFKCCYNGIDIESVKKKSNELIDFTPISRPALVSVGRLEHVKGYSQLLRSFAKVVNIYHEASLTIIGEGSIHTELEELSRKLGIEDNVSFLGSKENPFPYVKQCDICVQASINEGFPNVIVEAGACGLPVISADCKAGPREILSCQKSINPIDGIDCSDYGILVPSFRDDTIIEPEKEDLLAGAILAMIQDTAMKERYAKLLLERIEMFSSKKYEENIIDIIENTKGGKR